MRKLFEKMLLIRIESFVESNLKLSPMQYGFRKTKNILYNLLDLSTNAYKSIGSKEYMATVFLDIKGAYNNVQYSPLFEQFSVIGLNIHLSKLLINLISNNNVHLYYNDKFYGARRLDKGLTQGGILSPILYLIYTSQLFKSIKTSYILEFADDLVLFEQHQNLTTATENLQSDLLRIHNALVDLGLELSPQKCNFIVFSNRQIPANTQLVLLDQTLPLVNNVRYLGLIFDSKLTCTLMHFKLHRIHPFRILAVLL